MQSWADEQKTALTQMCKGWDVWWVRSLYPKGYTWHARPTGHPVAVYADSPENLIEAIGVQETSPVDAWT